MSVELLPAGQLAVVWGVVFLFVWGLWFFFSFGWLGFFFQINVSFQSITVYESEGKEKEFLHTKKEYRNIFVDRV